MRDSQRRRVYDAEAQVRRQLELAAAGARTVTVASSTVVLPLEVRFGSLDAAQRYADAVRASAPFAQRFPHASVAPLRVRRRKGAQHAHYEPPGTIALHDPRDDAPAGARWSLRELVLVHEIAHHAAHHDLPAEPAHGPAYAGAFLAVADHTVGPEVALLLTAAFAEHGVAVTPIP